MPCPASTRLMRRSMSGQQTVNVGAQSTTIVPYSPTRVALIIAWSGAGGAVYVSYRLPISGVGGVMLADGMPYIVLTLGDHGEMVRGPWYAYSGDTGDVTIIDAHLPMELPEG